MRGGHMVMHPHLQAVVRAGLKGDRRALGADRRSLRRRAARRVAQERAHQALLRALAAPGGSLIEVLIDVDVITTRGTLSAIRARALG